MEPFPYGGVPRQQVPGPTQGIGGGFMAGRGNGKQFIAELLVGQSDACVLVDGMKEPIQQIVASHRVLPALANQSIDQPIHGSFAFRKARLAAVGTHSGSSKGL